MKGGQMMPRPKDNTERVNVFFTPEVLSKIKEEAQKRGMTVSGYIRFAVLEYLKSSSEK
jgi:hypothetical protein